MAIDEDFDTYFADFGVDSTLNGAVVRGIFDDTYGESFGGLVAGGSPVFRIPSSVAASVGNPFVLSGASYRVASVRPDGTGMTTLVLESAA